MIKLERKEEIKRDIEKYSNELNEEIHYRSGYPPENEYPQEEYKDKLEYLGDIVSELERELREIEYIEEESNRRKEISELIHNEVYIIRDSESTKDLLSRNQHAQEISKLIANKKTLSPLTLGIYGQWGEGKSSFLTLIANELEDINSKIKNDYQDYNKIHIVRFDASEYNDQDKIWFSMLSQLFTKYEEEMGVKAKIKYGYIILKDSIKNNRWYYYINALILVLFISWLILYTKDKSIIEVIKDNTLYTNILGMISTVAVAINIVLPALKKIMIFSKPMSDKVISQLKFPDYKDLLGTREKVKESLNFLIQAWTQNRGDKIVVLVDELDRCSEKTIVEFFDALQLFLPVESIIHVISINKEAVCFALANRNSHFFDKEIVSNSEKLSFGQKFLEKYITIPYHLPLENNYANYISNLLVDSSDNTHLNLFSESEINIIINSINDINKNKHITPREIKKVINLLLLSKERLINIYRTKEDGFILKFEEYIIWFLLKYFYPKSAEIIIDILEEHYDQNYNKLKTFNHFNYLIHNNNEFKENPEVNECQILFKYLGNIRIDYIIISNRASENLIV
jgi:hypothetical protein